MFINVNGTMWHIQFKKPTSSELRRSDGTISLGVTDNTTKTVTIADNVSDYMADKILCHELVHVYSFSYGCDIDIVCSKIFTPTAANQNTCCEAHRQQRATELRKIREKKRLKRKPVKKNKLAEICEIAKSKGMSYGQYMAEQYKKEVTIR